MTGKPPRAVYEHPYVHDPRAPGPVQGEREVAPGDAAPMPRKQRSPAVAPRRTGGLRVVQPEDIDTAGVVGGVDDVAGGPIGGGRLSAGRQRVPDLVDLS